MNTAVIGYCSGEQAEMREDLGNHRGIFDSGDKPQGAVAIVVMFGIEYPFE